MNLTHRPYLVLTSLILLALALVACGASATATPVPVPTVEPAAATIIAPTAVPPAEPTAAPTEVPTQAAPAPIAAPGIDDPSNLGWPRTVTAKNGVVELESKPMRVLSSSMGHSEMLAALIDPSRIVGISRVSDDTDLSNIAPLIDSMQDKQVAREAEQIIAKDPDLVIFSSFAKPEIVQQLETLGISVIQTEFDG
nr:hypothetical protein [Chloroflexota bacterium]